MGRAASRCARSLRRGCNIRLRRAAAPYPVYSCLSYEPGISDDFSKSSMLHAFTSDRGSEDPITLAAARAARLVVWASLRAGALPAPLFCSAALCAVLRASLQAINQAVIFCGFWATHPLLRRRGLRVLKASSW